MLFVSEYLGGEYTLDPRFPSPRLNLHMEPKQQRAYVGLKIKMQVFVN